MNRDFFPHNQGTARLHALQANAVLNANPCDNDGPANAVHQKWNGDMANDLKTNPKNAFKEGGPLQSASCIRKTDKEDHHQGRYLDITAMIRSLQRTEGLSDCFRRGIADCDQLLCSWRQYCLDPTDERPSGKNR